MKILHISSAKNFGGGEKHFVEICRGLQNQGHDVFAVVRPTSEWKDKLNFLPAENIIPVSIKNSFGVFSSQKIARFIKENNIEIVHAHVARDYFPASLACRIAKTPKFVITRHVLFPMKSFHRFALNNLTKAIAVSQGVKKELQNLFPTEKITVISNGVTPNNFSQEEKKNLGEKFRTEFEIPADSLFIGTVGELKELKGQRDFVLAAQIAAEKFPNTHFAIIGKDNTLNQAFRIELKRMVKVFGLEDKFLWLNWVENMEAMLNALDIYVSPSHSESFGLATLEAMSEQKAIVATQTEGSKELLENNKTGFLVPVKEPVRLAESIIDFLSDENLRIELGKNAGEAAENKFSLKKMIEETEKIYQSLK